MTCMWGSFPAPCLAPTWQGAGSMRTETAQSSSGSFPSAEKRIKKEKTFCLKLSEGKELCCAQVRHRLQPPPAPRISRRAPTLVMGTDRELPCHANEFIPETSFCCSRQLQGCLHGSDAAWVTNLPSQCKPVSPSPSTPAPSEAMCPQDTDPGLGHGHGFSCWAIQATLCNLFSSLQEVSVDAQGL